VAGAWPGFDGERLLADTQKICATQISFWHGRKKPPFGRYVFMLYATEDGYGGLEHRASTALIANRRDLPVPGPHLPSLASSVSSSGSRVKRSPTRP
jgi:predicted metalloprotease with PDZ domain